MMPVFLEEGFSPQAFRSRQDPEEILEKERRDAQVRVHEPV